MRKYRRRERRPDLINKVQQIDLLRLEQLCIPRPIELLLHCMRQWPPSGVSNHSETFERSPAVLSSVSGCTYITQHVWKIYVSRRKFQNVVLCNPCDDENERVLAIESSTQGKNYTKLKVETIASHRVSQSTKPTHSQQQSLFSSFA